MPSPFSADTPSVYLEPGYSPPPHRKSLYRPGIMPVTTTDSLSRLHTKYKRRLNTFTGPFLWEARCSWLLHETVQEYVRGGEGASVDCGLVLRDDYDPLLTKSPLEKLSAVTEDVKGHGLLLGLDMKTIRPLPTPSYRGSVYYYLLSMKEGQNQCAAFMVQNPSAPQWVAFVPAFYIHRWKGKGKTVSSSGETHVYFPEMPLSDRPTEPFPMPWAPFVLPLPMLPEAIRSLLAYHHDKSKRW